MFVRECNSVEDVVREAFDLVRRDRAPFDDGSVMYYFRGENRNINGGDGVPKMAEVDLKFCQK